MTREELKEMEAFKATLIGNAARINEYVSDVTRGMTTQQRNEVVDEAFVIAWGMRKSYDPTKTGAFAAWYGSLLATSRLYLRTVRPEVRAHKPRCQCYGCSPCEFARNKRTADYAPGRGILDLLNESILAARG